MSNYAQVMDPPWYSFMTFTGSAFPRDANPLHGALFAELQHGVPDQPRIATGNVHHELAQW